MASIVFFAPLTAKRVYESAFALKYRGVNSVGLYANLMIIGVISFVYSVLPVINLTVFMNITGTMLILGKICLAIICLTVPTKTILL